MSAIAPGKVVSIRYTLRDAEGEELDASEEGEPLLYLHGAENIVPGLERQLEGLAVGATLKAVVSPEEGYGELLEAEPEAIPRSSFPPDLELEPGFPFGVDDDEGNPMTLFVVSVEGDEVLVDINHPLAGEVLHFEVEVLAIRDASEDELEHGHPHGPTGHEAHDS